MENKAKRITDKERIDWLLEQPNFVCSYINRKDMDEDIRNYCKYYASKAGRGK